MSRRHCVGAPIAVAAIAWLTFIGAPAFAGGADPVPRVPKRDPAMSAAFARAAATFDVFLAVWRAPPSGANGFAVKLGLVDSKDESGFAIVRPDSEPTAIVEWFWCGDLASDGERFTPRIGNEPETQRNVEYGQLVAFTRADIGDWMYWRGGKIVGNATACPALAYASAEERRQMKAQYGIDCD
jgi:uncharacterized protein YegJ (DUF2314 family)